MSRDVAYCDECGARLTLYVVGVCSRCHFDLTGEDEERDARERRERVFADKEAAERWQRSGPPITMNSPLRFVEKHEVVR